MEVESAKSGYISNYEDLKVYRLAFDVSLEVHRASLEFPKIEQYALADQMRRASKSICANIAEGFAKQSFSLPEFPRFLGMAIASSVEMQVWSSYAQALKYIDDQAAADWKERFTIIEKMLGKLRYNARKQD